MKKAVFQNIIFAFCLITISLPLAHQYFKVPEIEKLASVFYPPTRDSLTVEGWLSGKFQERYIPYYEYQIGARPLFIRLRNQAAFSLFNESTHTTIVGKENQLLDINYYKTYMGIKLTHSDTIIKRINNMATVIDSLEAMGKTVLTIIAPNKVDVFKEYLPDGFDTVPITRNSYLQVRDQFNIHKIDYLDFNQYFKEYKDSLPYPIISNSGLHWSGYGLQLATAQMLNHLENKSQQDLVKPGVESWQLSNEHVKSESDLGSYMNLMNPFYTEPLAKAIYLPRDPEAKKIKVLIIGDSFFYNFFEFPEVLGRIFHKDSRFWYYNNTQIDMSWKGTPVPDLSAHEILEQMDYVIFMASAYNMNRFPFGFPEKFLSEN